MRSCSLGCVRLHVHALANVPLDVVVLVSFDPLYDGVLVQILEACAATDIPVVQFDVHGGVLGPVHQDAVHVTTAQHRQAPLVQAHVAVAASHAAHDHAAGVLSLDARQLFDVAHVEQVECILDDEPGLWVRSGASCYEHVIEVVVEHPAVGAVAVPARAVHGKLCRIRALVVVELVHQNPVDDVRGAHSLGALDELEAPVVLHHLVAVLPIGVRGDVVPVDDVVAPMLVQHCWVCHVGRVSHDLVAPPVAGRVCVPLLFLHHGLSALVEGDILIAMHTAY